MALERNQELQPLDKSTMAATVIDSSNGEPETWYKVIAHADAEEAAESPWRSEDELIMSHGRCLCQANA